MEYAIVRINRKGGTKNVYNKKYRSGVTLIELLIVVLILAALSAIAIPRISQSATNAKAKACATNIAVLNSAIERYYVTNGSFPPDILTVTKNTAYFPDGQPVCPVTNAEYPNGLTSDERIQIGSHAH
ncbi:MAG TPA: prepilin-type N-terminal cleavage/methylation domain-containing protein [Phycisphaerales bacterium]|nr:prepilin-type N-terminal cleavage/methylation domain-containing protein [Phycisphaerales bacterium]